MNPTCVDLNLNPNPQAHGDLNPTCADLYPPTASHDHQNATIQPEFTDSERGRPRWWQAKSWPPTSTNDPTPAHGDLNPTCANLNPPTVSHDHRNATTQPEITDSERGRPRWGKKNREIEREKKAESVISDLGRPSVGWRERVGVWD